MNPRGVLERTNPGTCLGTLPHLRWVMTHVTCPQLVETR